MPIAVAPYSLGIASALVLAAGLVACSHVEPHAKVDHSPAAAASAALDARAVFPPFAGLTDLPEASEFTGWMPYALGRIDRTRLGLLNVVTDMGRNRALYEGSLFALTPPLLYGVTRSADHPKERTATLALGSALAVWGGMLSRTPAGAENTLAGGAHKMGCLMAESSEFLYTRSELPLAAHERRSQLLANAIVVYNLTTQQVMAQLQAAPASPVVEASCTAPKSAACKARRQQRNTGGSNPVSGLDKMQAVINQNLQLANERLDEVQRLEGLVDLAAPLAMLQRAQAIMLDLENELRGNRPELLQIKEAMSIVTEATRTLRAATAQGSGRPAPPAQIQMLEFPPAHRQWGRRAQTADDSERLRDQLDVAQRDLAFIVQTTSGLKKLQQDKKEGARRLGEDMQCGRPAPLVIVAPAAPASGASAAPVGGVTQLPVRS
jgi:hypothetical protein